MIVIAGVLFLAAAGLAVALLSAAAARAPDRAAMLMVLAAAGAGMATFMMLLVGTMVFGLRGAADGRPPRGAAVAAVSTPRLAGGLAVATLLLAVAGVLIRTGDWRRADDDVLTSRQPDAARRGRRARSRR